MKELRSKPRDALPATARPDYGRRPRWRSRRLALYALATVAVVVGVVGRDALVELVWRDPAPTAVTASPQVRLPAVPQAVAEEPSVEVLRQQALARVQPELDRADALTKAAVLEHVAAIDAFFEDAKRRTPRFGKKILGWSSKWRLVSDKLPFTRDDRHAQFLARTFDRELFSGPQLTAEVQRLVDNYTATLAGIENQMLVRMRADLADLPPAALPRFVDDATLAAAFERAMTEATARVSADFRADVTRETVSLVVGEVLAMAAVRLGVSGGLLAAGAGSSWATFGIGLVVAVIVDQIISWVWDWWADPVGDVSAKMNGKLDEIRRLIVEGDGASAGLRGRLTELGEKRDKLRRRALAGIVNEPAATRPSDVQPRVE